MRYTLYWDPTLKHYVMNPQDGYPDEWNWVLITEGSREYCQMKAINCILIDRGANMNDELYQGCN